MTDSESESEGFSRPYQGLKTRTIFVFVAGHDDDEGRFLVVAHANIRALASAAAGDDRFKYLFDPHLNRVKNPDLLRQGCEYVVSKNKTIKAHNVPSRMRLKPKPPPVAPNVMRIREAHPLVTEKELENLVLHFAYFDDGEGRVALAEVHQLLHVCGNDFSVVYQGTYLCFYRPHPPGFESCVCIVVHIVVTLPRNQDNT
eukprot:m.104389 g.104389  ORF g.104389 m.104389 type:complete len:200 (-) comp18884_c0_seq3:439-1038(-)